MDIEKVKEQLKARGIQADFEPTKVTAEERLEAVESAMLELIAMTLGGDIDA